MPKSALATSPRADRNGGRTGVAEIQRARMISALAEVAGERGASLVTVSDVVARSGVSRRTFYELFDDREDCFLAAFDQAVERAARQVVPAFTAECPWRERVRAGLAALLRCLEEEPAMGALCVVDSLAAGPAALERRARVVGALIDAVHEGRHEARAGAKPTRLTAEGVVGAVLAVLHARLSAPDARRGGGAGASLSSLLGPLTGMIVLPYLGPAAAARETSRPAPRRKLAPSPPGDPLRELHMRLTYRTVRVLLAIAELSANGAPGPSNREVARAADITDQGQISKLLARLEHLGLIANAGAGQQRGEPNVWRLTTRGAEIEQTIRRQAAPA